MGLNTLDFHKVIKLPLFLYITQNAEIISCKKNINLKKNHSFTLTFRMYQLEFPQVPSRDHSPFLSFVAVKLCSRLEFTAVTKGGR